MLVIKDAGGWGDIEVTLPADDSDRGEVTLEQVHGDGKRRFVSIVPDQLPALISALQAALPDGGWLPIESAPRDGTVILGYRGDMPLRARVGAICWLADSTGRSGWVGAALNVCMQHPTNWQHLPPPPPTVSKGDGA